MANRSPLTQLPDELIVLISEWLDQQRDLLALSLTNRRIFPVAIQQLYIDEAQRPVTRDSLLFQEARRNAGLERVQLVFANGASINAAFDSGHTPLVEAVYYHNVDMTEWLLINGADPECRTPNGSSMTAMQTASQYPHFNILKLLLQHGADVRCVANPDDDTPLHLGARFDTAICEMMIGSGADVNAANLDGFTPLHFAVIHDMKGCVSTLLRHNANPSAETNLVRTPLYFALKSLEAGDEDAFEIFKQLLNAGSSVNVADVYGVTPLHLAAGLTDVEPCRLLIERGANIHVQSSSGTTPTSVAWLANNQAHLQLFR